MRKTWWIGGAGILVAAGVATAVAVGKPGLLGGKGKDGKPDVTLEFAPREVVQPLQASLPVTIEFSGPLVAPQTAVVRAKAVGTLTALLVSEGSRVRAGQNLGQLDLAELSTRVNERAALLASARAQLEQAERTHASNQRLADQQFISANALESSRATLETARAQVRAAQAQLETTRVTLSNAALVAPISGLVAKRHVVPGEKLAPEQEVLTIVDLSRLELAGSVATHEVSQLAPGIPVQVRVEGVAQPVEGQISRIAPAAEPGTRSIGVTIELPNPRETLRAGQYAVARVTLEDPQRRLTLPANAVASVAGQDHVWVIENGTLARRAVTLGRRDDREGRVEVLTGVLPDSKVLSARFDNLREGAKAVVTSGSANAGAVASAAASAPTVK